MFEAMNLPPEVFIEICTLLGPSDLSSLIWTCTSLCDFLLDPGSKKRIWDIVFKRARASGMPKPPAHLSQPAFAHLLFAPFCHNCGKASVRKVIWPWSKRYCSACLPKVSHTYKTACKMIEGLNRSLSYASLYRTESFNLYHTTYNAGRPDDYDSNVRVYIPQLEAYIKALKVTGPIVKPCVEAVKEVVRAHRADVKKRADARVNEKFTWRNMGR
ncbi:hypothetical protein C8T65DRAFT_694922 [Cerioporus squamosus]|nr:hypothetical protein C8T65DRAFT_694922 [Cerioporus squamosus]